MKKTLAIIFVTFIILQLNAQSNKAVTKNASKPGELPINIDFNMGNGIKMTLEMYKMSDLDAFKPVDALLNKFWADLLPIRDSIAKPTISKRIDYFNSAKHGYFKITEHVSDGVTYRYKDDQLHQTKTGEDTLRIGLQTFYKIIRDTVKLYRPVFITFTLDKIESLTTMKDGMADSAISLIQNNTGLSKANKAPVKLYYNYDPVNKIWLPLKNTYQSKKRVFFEPDLYVGLQYARGSWVTSAAAGFQLIHGDYEGERDVFKLLWEPHFIFTKNISNSVFTNRNDFVTFRYYHYNKTSGRQDYYPLSFSFGYLVGRKGDFYEKNTFKFSVPGVTYKSFSLEPEFFFNDFFKHFSPSLKLNFNID